MKQNILLDTGPLVASINKNDRFFEWAKNQFKSFKPPLLTYGCHGDGSFDRVSWGRGCHGDVMGTVPLTYFRCHDDIHKC